MNYEAWLTRFGQVVKRYRLASELTQFDLAEQAGCQQSDISRLERGQQGFDSRTAYGISKVLGIAVSTLIAEAEDIPHDRPRLTRAALTIAEQYGALPVADQRRFDKLVKLVFTGTDLTVPPNLRLIKAAEPRAPYGPKPRRKPA